MFALQGISVLRCGSQGQDGGLPAFAVTEGLAAELWLSVQMATVLRLH